MSGVVAIQFDADVLNDCLVDLPCVDHMPVLRTAEIKRFVGRVRSFRMPIRHLDVLDGEIDLH